MRFQREPITMDLCMELKPLLERHYKEIAHFKDIPLDPAYDQYIAFENAGLLRCYTARDDNGTIQGYSIFFVRNNLHYKSSLQAVQDILFLSPEHRHAGFGKELISFCDDQLKSESVQAVYHHVKAAHNFGPLLDKLGYRLVDLIFSRRLD